MRDSTDFSAELERLSTSAWAYAALAAALETGLLERLHAPSDPRLVAAELGIDSELAADLTEALLALGVVDGDAGWVTPTPAFETLCGPSVARVLQAGIRGDHVQIQSMLSRLREGGEVVGWDLDDPVALVAQGETGSLIGLLVEALLPRLDGLAERMGETGARILDVGAGVGVVATELCRLWPEAEAVGLEPHRTARELGISRIAAAGLSDRIALRDERLEALGEIGAYDLAFVPQPFLDRASLEEGLPRIRRALRPGGWLIVLTHELPVDDRPAAAARSFQARIWGGGVIGAGEIAAMLGDAGYGSIRGQYPVGAFRATCARRPVNEPAAEVVSTLSTGHWNTAAP